MYRINYGNCQVSGIFDKLRTARGFLNNKCDGYSYMQKQEGNGEWFSCNPYTGHFLDMTLPVNKDHPASLYPTGQD